MSLKGIGKFIRGRSKSEGREPSDYTLRDLETVRILCLNRPELGSKADPLS